MRYLKINISESSSKFNTFFFKYLYLEGNQIEKLPEEFFELFPYLKWLDVSIVFYTDNLIKPFKFQNIQNLIYFKINIYISFYQSLKFKYQSSRFNKFSNILNISLNLNHCFSIFLIKIKTVLSFKTL